jgi:hypothetical protein
MTQSVLLTPTQALNLWPFIKEPLESALSHGCNETSLTEWVSRVLNYQAQLWLHRPDGERFTVGLTQFLQYSNYKTLHIVAVGGNGLLEDLKDAIAPIEDFARKNGCKAVEQWGRRGWAKTLTTMDPKFKVVYHVMRKELDETTQA